MLNIQEKYSSHGVALFRLGFRPFFLGASIYAVVAVAIWSVVYATEFDLEFMGLSATVWHAHEMLFGYAMAVIAGFLLTAIKNWTGQQTIRGAILFLLFASWLLARALSLVSADHSLVLMAAFDLLFMTSFVVAAFVPVLKTKQYAQLGILSKLVLMLFSNVLFYLGVFGVVEAGVHWGLYSGLYMILALLLVMARRVIPFFIEKGTDDTVVVQNWQWIDRTSLVLLLLLWIIDVFTSYQAAAALIAAALFVVHVVRMYGWYTNSLWNKPLLWVLFVAYGFVVCGFLLKAAELWFAVLPLLYVHAFAYGGIGMMTIGMMSRVILGHTGRDVLHPPAILNLCFALLVAGAIVRVLFPLLAAGQYQVWIALSQLGWIAAFLVFIFVYAPMLLAPRIDGRDG